MKRGMLSIMTIVAFSWNSLFAITIEDVLAQIKQNNTELKYTTAVVQSQSAEINTTNNLSNPVVDGSYLFGNGPVGDKWEVGISQEFDWPGLYSARGAANKARVDALKHTYSVKQMQILNEAYNLCLDIVSYNRKIEFEKEIMKNIDDLYEQNMKAFKYGEVSIIDVNKLKVEKIGLQQKIDDYVSLRSAKVKELEGLNANTSLNDIASLSEYPSQKLYAIDEYLSDAKMFSPDIQMYAAEKDADNLDVKVAQRQGLPKFSVGYKHAKEDGGNFNGATVGMSLPIFENKGKKQAAKAKMIATQFAEENALAETEKEVNSNYQRAVSLAKQLDGYKDALEKVDNVAILDKALAGGQISLLTYLQELRYFVDAKAVMLDMENDYNRALSQLNKYKMFR